MVQTSAGVAFSPPGRPGHGCRGSILPAFGALLGGAGLICLGIIML
jgi:hypothetical protein